MYYEIGKYLSEKVKSEDWGSKVIDKLVLTIKSQYPYLKGFNRAGLYRMIQFYETYRDNLIVSPLVTQLSWINIYWFKKNKNNEGVRIISSTLFK